MARKSKEHKKSRSDLKKSYNTKRCWNCNTHMKLPLVKCPSCNHKVGPVNEHGVGMKPVDWKNYLLSIIAISILCYFIWWAFLKGS